MGSSPAQPTGPRPRHAAGALLARALPLAAGLLLAGCGGTPAVAPAAGPASAAGGPVVRIVGNAGIPDAELRRVIDAAMRQGCGTGLPPDRTGLDTVWTISRLAPYPQLQITALLSRAGRSLAAVSATVGSPQTAPNAVFVGAVGAIACRLLARAAGTAA